MNRYLKTCLAGLMALALSVSGLDAATELFRQKGEQFFDSSGDPLAGGKVYYYEAGTTNLQTTYSDAAGSTANANPIVLDAAGRLTVPVYFGDSDSFSDYKEDLNTSADVAVSPWPFDDIPAATPADSGADFAPPLLSWTQVVSGASPVALTASDAGNAYEADTTSGNIEFDLPSAASVGDGKGFIFKKMAAANSMIIDQSGSETIDDSATALTVTRQYRLIGIFSNGAEWYRAFDYLADFAGLGVTKGNLIAGDGTDYNALGVGSNRQVLSAASGESTGLEWRDTITASSVQATTSGTAFDFSSLPAGLNKITVIFDQVSLDGTDNILVQLGDSGGLETTGYTSTSTTTQDGPNVSSATSTSGFIIRVANAARTPSGSFIITRITSDTWVFSGSIMLGSDVVVTSGGSKSLSAELDRVRVTRSGTDSFDAGQVNIFYE